MTLLNEYKPTAAGISPLGEVPAGQGGKDFSSVSPLPAQEQDSGGQVLEFTGLDLTEKAGSGAFLECENVSTRNYPCLSPRKGRAYRTEAQFQDVDDIFRWDGKTVCRKGDKLYFHDGTGFWENAPTVDDTHKSFAVVNDRLTIWPDGTCIHLGTGEYTLLGARKTVTAGSVKDNRTISGTFADRSGVVDGEIINTTLTESFGELRVAYLDEDGKEQWRAVKYNDYTWLRGKTCIPASTGNGYEIRSCQYVNGKRYGEMEANKLGVTAVIGEDVTLHRDSQHDYEYRVTASVSIPTGKTTAGADVLREGDVVFINGLVRNTGTAESPVYEEVPEIAARIWGVTAGSVTFALNSLYGYSFPYNGEVSIERRIPDLAYVCSNDNRLWGVSNAVENTVKNDDGETEKFLGRAIYASKLGDPGNWFYYQGVSMDSWTAAVASEGDFTGICEWSGDVLCFKEREMFRITGSVPSAYTLYSFSVPGVEQGSGGSIAIIDEAVFYKNEWGVYRYNGGTPSRVSENVADALTGAGNAGTDGRNYFLSVPGGIYVYDTWNNAWAKHDTAVGRFAWDGGTALFLNDTTKKVSRVDGDTADGMSWSVTMHPDYGTTKTSYYSTALNMGYKYFKFVFLRGELFDHDTYHPVDAQNNPVAYKPYVEVWAKMGEGKHPEQNNGFEKIGTQTGAGKFVLRMPVSRYREDRIQLMLKGVGDCVLRDVRYVYSTGSEWIQSDKGVLVDVPFQLPEQV